jgi:hypothetical protein
MNETLDEGVRYLPEGTFANQSQGNSDSLISMDLTPDESAGGDALDSLVNDNPWLIKYLVDGATDEADPNGNIALIIDDEDPPDDTGGSAGEAETPADEPPSKPAKKKGKKH